MTRSDVSVMKYGGTGFVSPGGLFSKNLPKEKRMVKIDTRISDVVEGEIGSLFLEKRE